MLWFWMGRINIVKVTTLLKTVNAIPIKLLMAFSTELVQKFLNLYGNNNKKNTLNSENNLEKEEWSWKNHAP